MPQDIHDDKYEYQYHLAPGVDDELFGYYARIYAGIIMTVVDLGYWVAFFLLVLLSRWLFMIAGNYIGLR